MGTVTNFAAGIDSSSVALAYKKESTWGVIPSGQYKQLRFLSEGFTEQKTRTRPNEVRADGQATHAITTEVKGTGSLGFGLSYANFEDFLVAALNAGVDATNFGSAAITTTVNCTVALATTVAPAPSGPCIVRGSGSWLTDTYQVGMWVHVTGFSNPTNNGFFQILAIGGTANNTIAVGGPDAGAMVTEGTPISVNTRNDGMVRNALSPIMDTFTVEKAVLNKAGNDNSGGVNGGLFFQYAGAYLSSLQLKAQVGGFVEGSANFMVKNQAKTANSVSSTNAVANYAAPASGRIIDVISGLQAVAVNRLAVADSTGANAVMHAIDFTLTKQNARAQFGIGSSGAVGMGRGTIELAGTMSMYFRNFTIYNYYASETDVPVSFKVLDNNGQGYIFTLPAVTLMNPKIVAGGPNTDIMADFTLEGNPGYPPYDSTAANLHTIQIDKFAA